MKTLILISVLFLSFHATAKNCRPVLEKITKGTKKHSNIDLLDFFSVTAEEIEIGKKDTKEILLAIREKDKKKYLAGIDHVLKSYAEFARTTGVTPSISDLNDIFAQEGFKIDMAKLIGPGLPFDSENELFKRAVEKSPIIKKAVNSALSTPQERARLEKALQKSQGVIVTSVINGAAVVKPAMEALLNFANKKKAIIVIKPVNLETDALDPYLFELQKENPNVFISIDEINLSQHWNINDIKVIGKQINPLMGLQRVWERGVNQIVASPKFEMETVATKDNSIYPHRLYTTGAITEKDSYSGKKYIQARTDELARWDHVIGALYLEKTQYTDNNFGLDITGGFHARHLAYIEEAKGFIDFNVLYTANDAKKVPVEAISLGDLHAGSTDQRLLESARPLLKELAAQNENQTLNLVLHDAWDGLPVNHHAKNKSVTLSEMARNGQLNIETGLADMVNYINAIHDINPNIEIVIVKSNHPDWLNRWIEADEWLKFPHNSLVYAELKLAMEKGQDPFEYALLNGVAGGPKVNKPKRLIFTHESYKVGPENRRVELAEHGDAGANGAKGSVNSFVRGSGRSSSGHTHFASRKNGVVVNGTFTPLRMPYNARGFSNWSQALQVNTVYGDQQLIVFENGEWKTPRGYKPSDKFFAQGYPAIVPSIQPTGGPGQIDQYTKSK